MNGRVGSPAIFLKTRGFASPPHDARPHAHLQGGSATHAIMVAEVCLSRYRAV